MAIDVDPIKQPGALIAARLCNFKTGEFALLPSHVTWLRNTVAPLIKASPNPWVDLFGYASHLGDPAFNKRLSQQRCDAVSNFISGFDKRVKYPQDFGFGDSRSTGARSDNDGQWRAVDVYVYGSPPPGPRPKPRPPTPLPEPTEWFVTEFSGSSQSLVLGLGFTAIEGHITFEKANGDKYRGAIGLFGGSVGLSFVPNLSKIPGLSYLFRKFPALMQLLAPESAGLSDAFLKWLMTSPSAIARLLWRSPTLNKMINMLRQLIGGGSVSDEEWIAKAIGLVEPFHGSTLQKIDFSGPCICYALTGTIAFGGFGTYVLFFGIDRNWQPWTDPLALVDLARLEKVSRGVAVIAAASASLQIPGLGAGATVFWGEIT